VCSGISYLKERRVEDR